MALVIAVCGLMLVALPLKLPPSAAGGAPAVATGAVSSHPVISLTNPSSALCNSTTVPPTTQVLATLCIGSWPQDVLVDSANGNVYAASESSQNVSVATASSLQKVQTISAVNARSLALDPALGRLFVTNGLGSTVTVLDTTNNNALLTTFSLAGFTDLVLAQYDPHSGLVYFLANNNADLVGVNPSSYTVSQVITVDPNPGGTFAVDPNSNLIYFPARGSDAVQVINQSTGETVNYVSMAGAGSPYGPTSTFYDPENGLIYAMLGGFLSDPGNLLYVFDTHTGNTIVRMTVGSFPSAYAFDPARNLLYVSCAASGTISVINVTSNELIATISLGAGTLPGGIAVDPATGNVYVGEDGTGLLVELPTAASSAANAPCQPTPVPYGTQILGSVCVGGWPQAIIYDPANGLIYSAQQNSQHVSVVDPTTLQVVATIPTNNYARGLALDPNNGRLFVSDGLGQGDDVRVVNTTTNTVIGSFNLTGYTYLTGAQFDSTTGQLFFLANNNDDLLSVDPTTYALIQVIPFPPNPGGGSGPIAAVDPQTHVMYFPARGDYAVDLIGELNGTTFGTFSNGWSYGPTNTFLDPSNHLLYVELGGWLYLGAGNQVVALNATTGAQVATMTVGYFPSTFGYDATRHLLYVSCAASGTISMINDTTNQVVGTISLGSGTLPGAVLVDPSTGNVFVGEDGTGMLVELPPATPSTNTTGYWSPVSTPASPTGRAGFGMVYDAAMAKVVVFGGCESASFFSQDCNATNDLWTYSAGNWTQLHPPVSPPARMLPSMAYDPASQEIVLFGGLSGYPGNAPLSDTWVFNGTSWTQLFPSVSPPASGMNQAMAYDPSAGAIVLFASGWQTSVGGPPSAYLNETWTFSHGQWTEVLNGTGPSPRGEETFGYDAFTGTMLLFGGSPCGYYAGSWNCPSLQDTWTYAGGAWTPQTVSLSPPARNLAAMTYDPQLNGTLLAGGQSGQAYYDDVWAYGGGKWSPFLSPLVPSPREGAEMVFDSADGAVVLFGGYMHVGTLSVGADLYYNDTWTFKVGSPPSGLSVVSMLVSKGPTRLGSLALVVGDILSASSVGYSFSGLPPGCVALDTNVLACAPTAAGSYTVLLTVTNDLGASSSGSVVLIVGVTQHVPLPASVGGVDPLTLISSGAAGAAMGVGVVAAVAYLRIRMRQRERAEGAAIARELENPGGPDRPTP